MCVYSRPLFLQWLFDLFEGMHVIPLTSLSGFQKMNVLKNTTPQKPVHLNQSIIKKTWTLINY